MGLERPGGPYAAEMTAGAAWPDIDETTLLDAADAFAADSKAVDEQLWVLQQARSKLFDDDAWSGGAADAAHAKHRQQIDRLQSHVQASAAVAKMYRDCAGVVVHTKQQVSENVENTQKEIAQVANHPRATAEQKDYMIKGLVNAAHTENIELVQAGAARLGKPPASPLTVRPADFTGRDVPEAPPKTPPKLPDDPNEFGNAWDKLSQQEKDALYTQDHFIGNHAGMPFADRDHYNRMHLLELQKANQAELDRLRAQHPDWAAGNRPGLASKTWWDWKKQWDAANHTRDGYWQVQNELGSPPDRVKPGELPKYLGIIDDKGHAAVSINNPDTAKRTATFVPGTGQDVARFDASAEKSAKMLQATLDVDSNLRPGDVSVTTWMGYDRPMNVFEAASASYAHNGAAALDDFQAGLRASHNDALAGGPSLNTVIGHSYGSTEVGAAAQGGHHLDANNVVAVGSPGMLAGHAGDLSLDPGAHVFATRAQNDIIGAVAGVLGPDPMSAGFGGIPFEAAPGQGWPLGLPSVGAHSSYWDQYNPALANMGKIIAGQSDITPPTFTP